MLLDMGSRGDAGSFASEHCWLPRAVSKINLYSAESITAVHVNSGESSFSLSSEV